MSVSTIIPFVNNVDTLDGAIASVLAIPACTQLLLVDDGSTDGSVAVARQWAMNDNRVQILQTDPPCPRGAGYARNLGIQHAQGTWITFLDADDYYLPNRFDTILNYKNDTFDYFLEAAYIIDLDQEISLLEKETINGVLAIHNPPINNKELFESVLRCSKTKNGVHINCISVKKSFLINNNLLFDETLKIGQDTLWKLTLFLTGKFQINNRTPSAIYHSGKSNRSNMDAYLRNTSRSQYTEALLKKSLFKNNISLKSKLFLLRIHLESDVLSKHNSSNSFNKKILKIYSTFNLIIKLLKG